MAWTRPYGCYNHKKVPGMAGGMAEDPRGWAGQYFQDIVGIFVEIGGFVPNIHESSWNFLGIWASSALAILCHTSCHTWNCPMTHSSGTCLVMWRCFTEDFRSEAVTPIVWPLRDLTTGPEPSSGRWDPYNCLLRLLIDSHQWDSGPSQWVGQLRWGYQSRPPAFRHSS